MYGLKDESCSSRSKSSSLGYQVSVFGFFRTTLEPTQACADFVELIF